MKQVFTSLFMAIFITIAGFMVICITLKRKIYNEMFDPRPLSLSYNMTNMIVYNNLPDDPLYEILYSNTNYKHTIIYCRGRYGSLRDYRKLINTFSSMPINILICDYPGYGKSFNKCSPSYGKCMDAVNKMYDIALNRWPHATNIVWGESLGSCFALDLLNNRDYVPDKTRLVILSGISSVPAVKDMDGIFSDMIGLFVNMHNNTQKMSTICCKVLVIHSSDDDIVPFNNASKLITSAANGKLISIRGKHSSPQFEYHDIIQLANYIGIKIDRNKALSFMHNVNNSGLDISIK